MDYNVTRPAALALLGAIPLSYIVLLFFRHTAGDQHTQLKRRIGQLQQAGFSRKDIAHKLDLKRHALYALLAGTTAAFKHSTISDADLLNEIAAIKLLLPQIGEKRVQGALLQRGLLVQRQRVRDFLKQLEGAARAERKNPACKRRVYHVKGPQSLWHADGLHKLIRCNPVGRPVP